jgi:hypothetical protein
MMTGATIVAKLILAALGLAFVLLRDRVTWLSRHATAILALLAAAALAGAIEYRPFQPVHYWEFYHYYVNTRYFGELGYTGLYDATVLADNEDDPGAFNPGLAVRSLETYDLYPRAEALRRGSLLRRRFTDERWAAFKSDVAVFRRAGPDLWRASTIQQDHGYNGSPVVTLVLGSLARQPFLPAAAFIRIVAWADYALILAAALLASRWIGREPAILFLYLWAVNPFNDYAMIGGAYLRYLHVVALFMAIAAWHAGRRGLSGGMFAGAALLRVFPGLLAAGLLARDALRADRWAALRSHLRFYAALAATAAALFTLSVLQPAPEGEPPWPSFSRKMALHSAKLSPNVLSLRYPFMYSAEHNATALTRDWQEGRQRNWIVESQATFAARFPIYAGVVAGLLMALVFFLRRGEPGDGWLAGLLVVYAGLHLSHYDYSVLALVPFFLVARPGGPPVTALLALFLVAAAWCVLPAAVSTVDLRFAGLSVLIGLYFVAVMTQSVRNRASAET